MNILQGNLTECERLTLLLGNAYGGRDMSQTARALLATFPGVNDVLNANVAELTEVPGVSTGVAEYLIAVGAALKKIRLEECYSIDGEQAFLRVSANRLRDKENEFAEFYLADKKGKVFDVRTFTSGDADRVEMSTDELLKIFTSGGAKGVYFAHNHVNGGARPSHADDGITIRMILIAEICGTEFFDHAIVNSRGEQYSYLSSGRMEELKNKVKQ